MLTNKKSYMNRVFFSSWVEVFNRAILTPVFQPLTMGTPNTSPLRADAKSMVNIGGNEARSGYVRYVQGILPARTRFIEVLKLNRCCDFINVLLVLFSIYVQMLAFVNFCKCCSCCCCKVRCYSNVTKHGQNRFFFGANI